MRKSSFAAAALAAAIASAAVVAPARAQTATNGKAFQATPYAGYMIFGNLADGPLGTSLSSANGPLYGAQLGVKLAPRVALVGNVGYASTKLQAGAPFIGGIDIANSNLLVYDAGVQLDIPIAGAGGLAFTPFVQAGAGAMRYEVSQSILKTQATNFAANFGVGADIGLGRTAAIRVMAKDYVGKFDFRQATGFDAPASRSHNVALTAGLRLDF